MKMWKQMVAAVAVASALVFSPLLADAAVSTGSKGTASIVHHPLVKTSAKAPTKVSLKTSTKSPAKTSLKTPAKTPAKKATMAVKATTAAHKTSALSKKTTTTKMKKAPISAKKPTAAASRLAKAGTKGWKHHPSVI